MKLRKEEVALIEKWRGKSAELKAKIKRRKKTATGPYDDIMIAVTEAFQGQLDECAAELAALEAPHEP